MNELQAAIDAAGISHIVSVQKIIAENGRRVYEIATLGTGLAIAPVNHPLGLWTLTTECSNGKPYVDYMSSMEKAVDALKNHPLVKAYMGIMPAVQRKEAWEQ